MSQQNIPLLLVIKYDHIDISLTRYILMSSTAAELILETSLKARQTYPPQPKQPNNPTQKEERARK